MYKQAKKEILILIDDLDDPFRLNCLNADFAR